MLDLLDSGLHVIGRNQTDAHQAIGIGAAKLRQEVVVGAQAGELQLGVVEQKDRSDAEVGIEHLRVNPVDIHVLEARGRVVATRAGLFPQNSRRLVLLEFLTGLDAQRQSHGGLAFNHPDIALGPALEPRRAVAQLGGDALGPQIAGFLDVIVRRYNIVVHINISSLLIFFNRQTLTLLFNRRRGVRKIVPVIDVMRNPDGRVMLIAQLLEPL